MSVVPSVVAWVLAAGTLVSCKSVPEWERDKKVIHWPLRANVGSLDPVATATQYSGMARAPVYESLYTYHYLKRPYELIPNLAASMPEVSDDGLVYTITMREGVRFHDAPCFEGGLGRELVAQDMVYSLMRMADKTLTPGGWWVYQDRIVGFDEFQARMQARADGEPFDWDARIEGLVALDRYRLQITLERPFPQLLFILAMSYSAAVPRECAERYGVEFGAYAVGTGPFRLVEFVRDVRLVYERNPTFRELHYPSDASGEARARGLLAPAGQRVPFADALVFHIYQSDEPMWLKFRVGDLDGTQVPAEYHDAVFDADRQLRDAFVDEGVRNYNLPLLDYIYLGFNMDDPVLGHPAGERGKLVRQAFSLAIDSTEINDAFYNNTAILYDGPIPPGLDGYQPGVTSPYRGPDIERARALLAQAGYPNGDGLPPLQLYTNKGGNSAEQVEMITRQVRRAGIELEVHMDSFAELSTKLKRRKAQLFSLSWGADYPDAENFLQLFYGPNASPGSGNFNYANPAYDALYERSRVMFPSPERTAIYTRMRAMIIEDAPAARNMARTRFYVWNPRLHHVMPSEVYYGWFRYLDVDSR